MTDRPDIADCPDAATFRQWYCLKSELMDFARKHGPQTSGEKFDIADRIAYFLDHGTPLPKAKRAKGTSTFDWSTAALSDDTAITDSYRNGQNVCRYFTQHIPQFAFSIRLMDWMKANTGKTLADAVVVAKQIAADKQAGVKERDQPHNQYNAYTRAYFEACPDGTQAEVRALWAARREKRGPYVNDPADLDLVRGKK